MKAILLQILAIICAIAAIFGVKAMDMPGWVTYPLLVIVVVLALLGMALAYYKRKPDKGQITDAV